VTTTTTATTSGARRAALRPRTAAFCAAAAAIALAAVASGWVQGADTAERWQLAARYTARAAFLLFLPVYVASAWNRLWPSAASRFAMRRRRALGLAFATAHTIHLGALTAFQVTKGEMPDAVTIAVGGGAFVAMFALVATSNDAAVRRLGKRWRTLHRIGVHWLWFVFAFSYFGRVAEGRLGFVPLLGAAVGALGLRIVAWRRRRARSG
jgi:DMSO/TMAO reductase YedYZ heme-binding membrane subunit